MDFTGIVVEATALLRSPAYDGAPRRAAQTVIATYWALLQCGMHIGLANQAASKLDADLFERDVAANVDAVVRNDVCELSLDTSDDVSTFISASIAVRILDELMATDEGPFIPSPMGAANAGEDWVDLSNPVQPFGDCFTVVVRPREWPSPPFSVDQIIFPGFAIRKCLVFPQSLGDYAIEIKREVIESRFDRLGLTDGSCAPGYVGAFPGRREWPLDDVGKPLGFAGNLGIDENTRLEDLIGHIKDALAFGCRLIVLPELTTTGPIQSQIIARLRDEVVRDFPTIDAMILAGTAHVERSGKKRNRAELIWLNGDPAIVQDKLAPIRTKKFKEDIDPSTTVSLLLTPMGPLGVFICRDFCDALPHANFDLLQHLNVGLLLVPSMGGASTKSAHWKRLNQAALHHWRVLLSQQRDHAGANNVLIIRCLSDVSEAKKDALSLYRNLS